ncbi:MAG: hypothetical protein H8E66_07355 [Planctomycetes bacterium]|nr:hypothetical protein [Planctomycetota bacterium]
MWASPATLLGLSAGCIGLLMGGAAQRRGHVLEFHGGFARWVLECMPNGQFVLAMTLGHTILGKTDAALDITRDHEMVHVRQYERWGPLFLPAYLLASLWLWLAGRDAYRDNPFERDAYDVSDPGDCNAEE